MKRVSLVFLLSIFSIVGFAQNQKLVSVGFYNLENYFDTFDDPNFKDEEYTPEGEKNWTEGKYKIKTNNMAYAVSHMNSRKFTFLPSVIGFCEVENKKCLNDMINHPLLKDHNYGIVHYDSKYYRGVDCALIYKKADFKVLDSKAYPFGYQKPGKDFRHSRDQLWVVGELHGERMHFIVNHWPSRWGGQEQSSWLRESAADLTRKIVDEIQAKEPNAKIIVMGDLNDDPNNISVVENLSAKESKDNLAKGDLFNASAPTFNQGNGTLAYRGQWNLFDQIIVSQPLLNATSGYKFAKYNIVNKSFLLNQEGKYKGYPRRTTAGGVFNNGYSDHLPVFVYLIKQ